MRKTLVLIICTMLLFTSMSFFNTEAKTSIIKKGEIEENTLTDNIFEDVQIDITYPTAGYLYIGSSNPINLPILESLGYAVVVGPNIKVDLQSTGVDHVKFFAKHMFTGWETVRADYTALDGFFCSLDVKTPGRYTITAKAYDDEDHEIGSDTVNVFFIKYGKDNFGVWIHTKYDGVENEAVPLNIGLNEFSAMLDSGNTKTFTVSVQSKDDTTIHLGFARETIDGKPTVETKFDVETSCNTAKEYEVYSEIKFPFPILNNNPYENDDSYFSIQTGYVSSASGNGNNKVDTTFYVGRDSMKSPSIFRMHLKPQNLGSDSQVTFFTKYRTVDEAGKEVFYRSFSIDFEPATELTVTSIPKEMKVSYDFGDSAGKKTTISFRAEGGLLDDIIQSYTVNPLPSEMKFDLTILGGQEFLYESDETYDVAYDIHSIQKGDLVTFEVVDIPKIIHAQWGLNIGKPADANVSSYAELDMSDAVEKAALYLFGNEIPILNVDNLPRKIRFEAFADLLNGNGEVNVIRKIDEDRQIDISFSFEDLSITNTFELKSNFVKLTWNIDPLSGKGNIDVTRDHGNSLSYYTIIAFKGWTISKELILECENIELSWDINMINREGEVTLKRDFATASPVITLSIAHDDWVLSDTIELENNMVELFWDFPTSDDHHAEVGVNTDGDKIFTNTLSFDGVNVDFDLQLAIATTEKFMLSWDHENGKISNFKWDGKILKIDSLSLSLDYAGTLFTIGGNFQFGESGHIDIKFNKDVTLDFINIENNLFKIHGQVSFYSNRHLKLSWNFGDNGFFKINTYGEPLGGDFSLEFGFLYSPSMDEYKYGFEVSSPDFVDTNLNISWIKTGSVPTFYKTGSLPDNWIYWNKQLLWNYERWDPPW